MNDQEKENEIIKKLLAEKAYWKKKKDFYHRLFHKYQRRVNFFYFPILFFFLTFHTLLEIINKSNKWVLITFLMLFLISLAFHVYFMGYFYNAERKLKECMGKISQINEQLIEIMVSSKIKKT